jgi:F0F1-type ATP synthase membrane subunit c/vacuolar-type H+-ATPase subunit K
MRNGVIVFAVGITAVGAGIPLAIIGGRRVPSEPEQPGAEPYVGLGGAGVRGRF